ncbi:MAG: hypothetical protein PF443_01375 [Allgaiera sp.]|nr:hypothetical protein [Allgaiera sp.]
MKQKDRIQRADIFDVPANAGKVDAIKGLWADWRRGLLAEALVARRNLMEGRQLRERLYAAAEAAEPLISASKARLGAAPQQMVRAQAVGTIKSWLGNRKNDVSDAIQAQFNPRAGGEGPPGAGSRCYRTIGARRSRPTSPCCAMNSRRSTPSNSGWRRPICR